MNGPDPVVPNALMVLRTGPMATIQDLGRIGHRSRGVPVGGAFDRSAHELANALAGNAPDAATIELTLLGGAFRAAVPLALALAGAAMPVRIRRDGAILPRPDPPVAFGLEPGDVLELGGAPAGVRTYLAVRGGWRTPLLLGSRSSEQPLRPGALLPAIPGTCPVRGLDRARCDAIEPDPAIRVVRGPDAGLLLDPDWHRRRFRVAPESDRMGIRLEGPGVAIAAPADRLSAPIAPGAVQIAGGMPILLGVACGTMGGYPCVAYVASADLDRLARLRPGQPVSFRCIALDEARRLDRIASEARRRRRLRVAAMTRAEGA